uniref:E2F-associated phosphoprotein n=1 Tax=Ascaris lumbricoides TaxID=6252 RepID=A0A0M3HKQ7_ASCLU
TSEANTGDSEETESDSGDDEEWDDDSLEAYFTPIDDDDAADAFVFYKETLESRCLLL